MTFYADNISQSSQNRSLGHACRENSIVSVMIASLKVSSLAALLFGLAACTASNSLENAITKDAQAHQTQSSVMTLKTVMTDEGVECPAVRGDDGTLYTITSMPHKFDEGDRLNIVIANPIVPVASFCQQGETIDWIRIEKMSPSGEILKHWDK